MTTATQTRTRTASEIEAIQERIAEMAMQRPVEDDYILIEARRDARAKAMSDAFAFVWINRCISVAASRSCPDRHHPVAGRGQVR